ncbi:DUF1847 domain-containing protein [uncultured Veillonella sp.]|uniref:DUF1847 domain-containing protein n=1 Tax=uncultured Veillonella sp. TaxID=159268 RepID=UPI002594BBDC|nr:DUF1847 domain-containing protein [uncultured Veillonella sp.]
MKCAQCMTKNCAKLGQNCTDKEFTTIASVYEGETQQIMECAACTEGNFYNELTRIEETRQFCQYMGYKKIGLAFCVGVHREARLVEAYFRKFFEVESVICKVCGVDKAKLGLQQIKEGARESMCNPAMQAKLLEEAGVEFNVSMGLCVGHDAIFNHASSVPVTVLVAKDRVLAHNPLGAIYSRYWLKKLGIYEEKV